MLDSAHKGFREFRAVLEARDRRVCKDSRAVQVIKAHKDRLVVRVFKGYKVTKAFKV
jgi:hypothetical protein